MSSLESAIYSLLHGNSALVTLATGGIFGDENVPEGTAFPYIVFLKISDNRKVAYNNARIQVSCFAKTKKAARDMGDKVEEILDRFKGVSNGVHITYMYQVTNLPGYEPDLKVYSVNIDFKITYKRTLI